jgi:8-oxo-dGTP diphosphatase
MPEQPDRNERKPLVGVGVIVARGGKILLGQRGAGIGEGMWGAPGGQLELNETFEECARREVREETGLQLTRVTLIGVVNDVLRQFDRHYVTIWMRADKFSGEITNPRPDENSAWAWYAPTALPTPLFPTLQSFLATYGGSLGRG